MKHRIQMDRLCKAMQQARLSLRNFRENRLEAVKQYAGDRYSEDGAEREVLVNLLSLYVSIVGRGLIAKNPRVMLSTFQKDQKPTVHAMEQWVNDECERLRIANTFQRIVLDGLFSIGIAKVALASPADASTVAWNQRAGVPFIERVDLDDFVFDVHARDFGEVGFIGHRFRIRTVVAHKMYGKQGRELDSQPDNFYNAEGDEKIDVMQKGFYSSYEEYADFVDLWEVYLPHERLVVTLADQDLAGANPMQNNKPLKEQRWIGPDSGPYHILQYRLVPGNALGKGPIQDLVNLHNLENNIYRKLDDQGRRMKELLLIAGGALEDGTRIQRASDGDIIRNDNPAATHSVKMGGADQALNAFGVHIWDLFGKQAGNLEMMGGLAPQSKTLGQDQMLAQNASGGMMDMQQTTTEFVSETMKALCWYWWHDPVRHYDSPFELPGLDDHLNRTVTPKDRNQLPWEKLIVRLDPYSLQHQTPQQRLQAINAFVQQSYLPMAQMYQQAGIVLDLQKYAQMVAKYTDNPDLEDLITMQEPPAEAEGPSGSGESAPGKPPETTRNYVRRSIGADTAANRQAEVSNRTPGEEPAIQKVGME